MNKQKEFGKIFSDYGGRFDVSQSDLAESEKQLLSLILDQINWNINDGFVKHLVPNAESIYFDYINSSDHNAIANPIGFKAIGINYGLVLHLIRVAGLLLSTKELFEDLESDELFSIKEIFPLFKNTFVSEKQIPARNNVLNKERTDTAICVTLIALHFIIGHEITHVLNHSSLFKKITNQNFIKEFFGKDEVDIKQKKILKALEIEADLHGAVMSFWNSVVLYQDSNYPLYDNYLSPSYVWIIAILSTLYAYEKQSILNNGYHPNVYLRQMYCISHVKEVIKDPEFINHVTKDDYSADFKLTMHYNLKKFEPLFGNLYLESFKDNVKPSMESMQNEYREAVMILERLK